MVVAAEEELAVERSRVAELEPKAQYVDEFVSGDDLMLLRALVPRVGMTETALRALLVEYRWIYRKFIGWRWSESRQGMVDEYERWPTRYGSERGYFELRPQHKAPVTTTISSARPCT